MKQTFLKSMRPSHVVLKVGFVLVTIAALLLGSALTAFAAGGPPTITVVGVVQGSLVTLTINNLPVNDTFAVSMGAGGSVGTGSVVAHFNSGAGGQQTYTFEILSNLSSASTIAVRIDDGFGVTAFTTFNNVGMTAPTVTTAPTQSPTNAAATAFAPTVTLAPAAAAAKANPVSPTVGSISVIHAQQGGWVQVIINNMPPNVLFTVTIGPAGSQGFGGYKVGDLPTGSVATHVSIFEIPQPLTTASSMDLRLEGGGFVYLITFSNTNK
jgi:hypothetical protein